MCELSRLLRERLKAGDARFMRKYALRVREQASRSPPLAGFFGATDVLVPVPGSAPHAAGQFWAAQDLAAALIEEGLGGVAWSGLRRVRAVHKSATAPPGERPTVDLHYASFRVEQPAVPPGNIVLIDDVVTKGRTLLAAAWRLQEAFPCAQLRAFAMLRTMGRVCALRQLLAPCRGEIRWRRGDAHRRP